MAGSPEYHALLDSMVDRITERARDLLTEAHDLHDRKNAGYAGADNPDPWANFRGAESFGVSAFDGCLVRLSDKFIRVGNLRRDPGNDRVGESIRDTLLDASAYALIGVCLLDEQRAAEAERRLREHMRGHR